MTDTPTLAEALKLADRGGPDWESLLARMECPRPWKHGMIDDWSGTKLTRLWCPKCNVTLQNVSAAEESSCRIPDPVTEPLPCIVDRKVRVIDPFRLFRAWDNLLGCGWTIQGWFKATPAQQLVCIWKAEGRLAE